MNKLLLKAVSVAALFGSTGVALASCGATATPEAQTYTGYRNDAEAGFEELLFPVTQDITLVGNAYTYMETTLLCHKQANNIVATHMYEFKGTFTVEAENAEEGTKTIKLSEPTWGMDKGTGTLLADDADLMDKFVIDSTVVLNTANYTATFTLKA